MRHYSYADTRELAPDMDEVEHDAEPSDAFGRDVDCFERDNYADSLDEFTIALDAAVDSQCSESSEKATPRTYARAVESSARVARVTDRQRALFDDAVTRYCNRFVLRPYPWETRPHEDA